MSNAPAPYNDALFGAVARQPGVELRVFYGASTEVHRDWRLADEKGYAYEVLSGWTMGGSAHLNPSVVRVLQRFAPDVTVLTGSYTMPTMQLAAATLWASATPWLYWGEELAHNPVLPAARAARAVLRRTLRRASGVLAIGSRARASYVRAGVAPGRIADFRYYADTNRFAIPAPRRAAARAALRAELGVSDSACVALYCGQLVARKGVDTLLRAVARMDASAASFAAFLAGDGPERSALEALATALGISDRVHWLGFRQQPELPAVFAAADAFVLPSHAEGWGVVVPEAMAAGLPVLASERVNAAADLVRAGENGATFTPGDDQSLARLLTELIAEPARWEAMGARARAVVRTESPDVAAPRLVRLLDAARAGESIGGL